MRVKKVSKSGKVKKVVKVREITSFIFVTLAILSTSAFAVDIDSTLRLVEKDMFPQEKIIKCSSCNALNSNFNKYCGNCGTLLSTSEITGNILIKGGGFIPVNSDFRDTYGSGFAYGIVLNLEYNWIGARLDIESSGLERLSPLTVQQVIGVDTEGDWKNVNTKMSVTPVCLSLVVNQSVRNWKIYAGIGIGVAMIREEFKGDYYFREKVTDPPKWGYADIIVKENLVDYQVFVGIIKSEKIGFEVKYSIIPTLSKFSFPDLGGLSTTISILF